MTLQPATPAQGLTQDPYPATDGLGPVTDVKDLRTMIPRCRRAIDGPQALSSGAVAATLDDSEVLAHVADSTAEVILMTGGSNVFGYQLVVTSRDPYYMAPNGWATDLPRTPEAEDVIIAQAAINYYVFKIRDSYTSESIGDEGQTWEWTKSANVIKGLLDLLQTVRDQAVERLRAMNAPLDGWISTVANRDKLTAMYLEPYVAEIGAPVPYVDMGGAYQGGYDFRFGSWG